MISDERLLDFTRALEAAVRSGLPLSDAFATLARSPAHGGLIAAAARLTARGTTLHEALAAQRLFPPVFIALVRAGEEGGKTDEFLDLFAGCLEIRIEFRRRIKRAMIYPAFAVLLGAALFLFITLKAVPVLLGPLAGAGAAAPAPWLGALGAWLRGNWYVAVTVGAVGMLALRALWDCGPARKARGLACHLVPGLRYATVEARLYNIYTTMALLLKAGLPPSAMMDVLLEFSKDDPLTARRFRRAADMLATGVTFSASLNGFIPEEDLCAMEIAEKTGRLEETLLRLGRTHHQLHLHRLKILSTAFTLSSLAALAPLCFLLIMSLIKPVLGALGGVRDLPQLSGSAPAGEPGTAPANPAPVPAPAAFDVAEDTAAALFNQIQGAKIAGFIKAHAVPKNEPEASATPAQGTAKPAAPAAKPKLAPVRPIKRINFGGVNSTAIQPSSVGTQ